MHSCWTRIRTIYANSFTFYLGLQAFSRSNMTSGVFCFSPRCSLRLCQYVTGEIAEAWQTCRNTHKRFSLAKLNTLRSTRRNSSTHLLAVLCFWKIRSRMTVPRDATIFIDLSFLSPEEEDIIQKVLVRDEDLKKHELGRVRWAAGHNSGFSTKIRWMNYKDLDWIWFEIRFELG